MKKILSTSLILLTCACSSNEKLAAPQEIAPIKIIENTYKAKEQNIQKNIAINVPTIKNINLNSTAIEEKKAEELKITKTPEEKELEDLIENIVNTPPEYDKFKTGKNIAALLLPLSGDNSKLGEEIFNAVQLALYELTDENNISIIPIDTKGTIEGANEAMDKAISKNAQIIIGPLFSHSTKAISASAKRNNINVISLSNDISASKDNIYLSGIDITQQIHSATEYSIYKGAINFYALLPDNYLGNITHKKYKETLAEHNLYINKTEWYEKDDVKLSYKIKSIVDDAKENSNPAEENIILIPEGGKILNTIAARLKSSSLGGKNFKIIGTEDWKDQQTNFDKNLYGSILASTPEIQRKEFEYRFEKTYGTKASKISAIAYDAVALAITLAKNKSKNKFSKKYITNKVGYAGVNGVFRFSDKQRAERGLEILKVTKDGLQIVAPADDRF